MDGPDPLVGLIGPRLAEPGGAEALAAFALGLCLAGLVALLPLLRRAAATRAARRRRDATLAAAEAAPEPRRSIAILRLAQAAAGPGDGPWRARAAQRLGLSAADLGADDGLYRPGGDGSPNAEAILAALRRTPATAASPISTGSGR